jgi:DNA polymerase III delta prime subunit
MQPLVMRGTENDIDAACHAAGCTREHTDTVVAVFKRFGVDDARLISERAHTKPLEAPHRTFIIVAADMTNEAQQALLKTLEEPPAGAQFVLIVPSPEMLLPTVRSRIRNVQVAAGGEQERGTSLTFLHATPSARLDMLKPLLETGDDGSRDIAAVLAFLAALEQETASLETPERNEALRAIYRARRYATDKGALLKPLLEQVALLI